MIFEVPLCDSGGQTSHIQSISWVQRFIPAKLSRGGKINTFHIDDPYHTHWRKSGGQLKLALDFETNLPRLPDLDRDRDRDLDRALALDLDGDPKGDGDLGRPLLGEAELGLRYIYNKDEMPHKISQKPNRKLRLAKV